jgi:hypothetical protein
MEAVEVHSVQRLVRHQMDTNFVSFVEHAQSYLFVSFAEQI